MQTVWSLPESPVNGGYPYTMGGLLDQMREDFPDVVATRIRGGKGAGRLPRDGRATATNPELAAARARQEALAETPEQARAGGRPTADIGGNAGYDRLGYGRPGSTGVTATLPIWTGGRVASAVRAASGDVAAGTERLRDAEAAVLERVVVAYADLL